VGWIYLGEDKVKWQAVMNGNKHLRSIKFLESVDQFSILSSHK
jgi:hypothetical protein